jgi:hypothetical protein
MPSGRPAPPSGFHAPTGMAAAASDVDRQGQRCGVDRSIRSATGVYCSAAGLTRPVCYRPWRRRRLPGGSCRRPHPGSTPGTRRSAPGCRSRRAGRRAAVQVALDRVGGHAGPPTTAWTPVENRRHSLRSRSSTDAPWAVSSYSRRRRPACSGPVAAQQAGPLQPVQGRVDGGRANAQPVSTTATAGLMAAAIRNLPTPTIGDPCAVDGLDTLTLALDRAAVATASTSCAPGRRASSAAG